MRSLSGGERNRLLLARLFARPANVLVLDEPTNDLDIDTLELLEELLQKYDGTVFIVSHDRMFLDNVATSTLVFEGTPEQPGLWREYEGGVQDWLTQSERSRTLQANAGTLAKAQTNAAKSTPTSTSTPSASVSASPAPDKSAKPRKLSYKEQRELEGLPDVIANLESEQREVQEALADPALYTQDAAKATQLHQRDAEIEAALMHALERWEALSN